MKHITPFIRLCRPEQYYKNIIIFLALFFSGNVFNPEKIILAIAGFISMSFMSSVNYIINDIIDRHKDRCDKEKALRPLAAGEIKVYSSIILACFLALFSLINAYFLNTHFFISIITFFLVSSLYSFFLKNEPFIDIIAVSLNYVVRALAGAYAIKVWVSPWLVVGTFFLALFLVIGKRKSEKIFLGKNAKKHRVVLKFYSDEMLNSLIQIAATTLLLSYALYSFLGPNQMLLFTLPIVLYIILRYLFLIESGSDKARHTHRIFKDYRISLAIAAYVISTFLILYLKK